MNEKEYIRLMRVAFARCESPEELREEVLHVEQFLENNVYRLLMTWKDDGNEV